MRPIIDCLLELAPSFSKTVCSLMCFLVVPVISPCFSLTSFGDILTGLGGSRADSRRSVCGFENVDGWTSSLVGSVDGIPWCTLLPGFSLRLILCPSCKRDMLRAPSRCSKRDMPRAPFQSWKPLCAITSVLCTNPLLVTNSFVSLCNLNEPPSYPEASSIQCR